MSTEPKSVYDFTVKVPTLVHYKIGHIPFFLVLHASSNVLASCSLKTQDIKGDPVSLSEYAGKVLLIVNVASQCALTATNYKELNALHARYNDKGLKILAFPSNQFMGQEPGGREEIEERVCTIFKAEFPVFDKIDVNGANAAPLYKFLKSQKRGFWGDDVKWNFSKFLVDKKGYVVERYAPTNSPLGIEKDIQKFLEDSSP